MAANGWRIMWVIAVYDCPMTSAEARHDYTQFRNALLKENFYQLQNSLYVRHYPTKELAGGAVHRLKSVIPEGAKVSFFLVTDKQYAMSKEFFGPEQKKLSAKAPQQVGAILMKNQQTHTTKTNKNRGLAPLKFNNLSDGGVSELYPMRK